MQSLPVSDDPVAQRILEERARTLARVPPQSSSAEGQEHVFFQLGAGCYALPAPAVREVYPLVDYTPLPSTPAHVVGLVNVRGRLLAAFDLRPLLDLAPAAPQAGAFLLLVQVKGLEVALLADAVSEVRPGAVEVFPALSAASGRGIPWIRGVDPQMNLILDPALLLADERLVVEDGLE